MAAADHIARLYIGRRLPFHPANDLSLIYANRQLVCSQSPSLGDTEADAGDLSSEWWLMA